MKITTLSKLFLNNLFYNTSSKLIPRHFSTEVRPLTSIMSHLQRGINFYHTQKYTDTYICLTQIVQAGPEVDDAHKAVAYLYLAKSKMSSSTRIEWLGIKDLEKAKYHFIKSENIPDELLKYKEDLENEYKKINLIFGGIEEYRKYLEEHMDAIGIDFRLRNQSEESINKLSKYLFEEAVKLIKQNKNLEAEKLLTQIIYELDPTRKEAYDKLVVLWGKRSVFGYEHDKLDALLEQYGKHSGHVNLIQKGFTR